MAETFLAWCAALGAPGLGLLAFAAATILPLGSEWLLAALLIAAPGPFEQAGLVILATIANVAGGSVTYGMAAGGRALAGKPPLERHPQAAAFVRRHGAKTAALGFVPWVGDALTLASGWWKVPFGPFLGYSLLGRGARYGLVWLGVVLAK